VATATATATTTEIEVDERQTPQDHRIAQHAHGMRAITVSSGSVAGDQVAEPFVVPGPDWSKLRRTFNAGAIRTFDIVVSGVALIVLLPVIVAAIVAVRLDSPGPAFFRSKRAGYRGQPLNMLKFRKMRDGATGRPITTAGDQRFTRIGVWLAKTKVDEIPQLWHVLRGEMSMVGPRPEDPQFVKSHPGEFRSILNVRPGVTGYSQIAFAEESSILDDEDPMAHYLDRLLPQKLAMDRMYAQQQSLRVNLKVLFWTTAAVILRRKVAVHRDSGKMNLRRR
jgi:lipopolysaccharide/colanic/teichoic acid biosynthesis glycosyltransferase